MIRPALILCGVALALAAAPADATSPPAGGTVERAADVRVAKAGKKKKPDKGADKGKPEDKVERPDEAPRDPRAAEPAPAPAPSGGGGGDAGMISEVRRGMSRIEFDDRLIQGQTNKANAIYLFERRESALRSLLRKRTHFHEEIDETLE
ncbi:MAG: hypothetical protein HYS27_17020 [Deltaproteobacteria bacterium]|nr:hypothetical protein [Deltaproteobacteria bacterium]